MMTERELLTIAAALRLFQIIYCHKDGQVEEDFPGHFRDTKGHPVAPLDSDELDSLISFFRQWPYKGVSH
jgi:hypothetical protein